MKTSQLSPSLEVSEIIHGLWQIADMERDGNTLDPAETAKAMLPYVESGCTTFDMADHYGSAEIITGHFQKTYQQHKVQLLTKWVPKPGPLVMADVREAVEKSLNRLQVDSIDLLQYHAWNYADATWLDGLFMLDELRKEGLIKNLGVTNVDAAHLNMILASGIKLVSNQVCYSLLDQRASGAMRDVCEKWGVKLLAFGTLAGGFLSSKWLGVAEPLEPESWSLMKYKRFIDTAGGWIKFQSLLKTLDEIALAKGASISNIATRYIQQQNHVAAIIIGARLGESQHLQSNLRLQSLELNTDDQSVIAGALELLDMIPGDCGDEYRKPPFLTASGDLSHHLETFPKPFAVDERPENTKKVFSGVSWEEMASYSRATQVGNRIWVSGTTASHGDQLIGGVDPGAQTHFIIDKIQGALQSLGADLDQVVRTRIFIKNVDQWEPIARAHGERFKGISPANTMVRADLIGDEFLVEIEAEAVII